MKIATLAIILQGNNVLLGYKKKGEILTGLQDEHDKQDNRNPEPG